MSPVRAATFGLVLVLGWAAASPASAQSPTDLSGSWQLKRDASQFPKEVGFNTGFVAGVRSGAQADGTSRGGGSRGGRGGGGGANRPLEPRAQNQSAEDAGRVRFLTDEVRNPYEHLTLTVTPATVTIAFDRVAPRTFRPGRRDEEIVLGPMQGVATATWVGGHLEIVYKAEAGRSVRYTYSVSQTSRQLIVDVEFLERGGGDMVRRVYEPASTADTLAASLAAATSAAGVVTPPSTSPRLDAQVPRTGAAPLAAEQLAVDQRPDAPLRGITRLGVVIEGLNADAEKCGLKQDAIERAVSKRLTDAGFRVASNSDEDTYLYVNINTATPSAGLCVSRYDVTLYSHTSAKLSHTAAAVLLQVELLHRGGLAGGSPAPHGDGVTKGVLESADQFVTQMRSANARTP